MLKNADFKKKLTASAVPLMFIIIIAITAPLTGFSGKYLAEQVVLRLARNAFLVLSLLLPVLAGLGINFGLVLGALAGQVGMIFVNDWEIPGAAGLFLAMILSIPIASALGWFAGSVMNRAKGREMITSMMLSFFMIGIYQAFVLYACGSVIKFHDLSMILSRGYGVRNSLSLKNAGGFDKFFDSLIGTRIAIAGIQIPILTFLLIGACCYFIKWFGGTKMGQDMRAAGQNMPVALSSGINVDRIRIQAMMLSTVMAAFGQIIYLQNIGTLNTYNGADQAALFAAAALLIGGATVSRATIPNALIGTILFHLLFIVMPRAGKNITGSSILGEYFRTFVSYAIVTVTLVIHAWRKEKDKQIDRGTLISGSTEDKSASPETGGAA